MVASAGGGVTGLLDAGVSLLVDSTGSLDVSGGSLGVGSSPGEVVSPREVDSLGDGASLGEGDSLGDGVGLSAVLSSVLLASSEVVSGVETVSLDTVGEDDWVEKVGVGVGDSVLSSSPEEEGGETEMEGVLSEGSGEGVGLGVDVVVMGKSDLLKGKPPVC